MTISGIQSKTSKGQNVRQLRHSVVNEVITEMGINHI